MFSLNRNLIWLACVFLVALESASLIIEKLTQQKMHRTQYIRSSSTWLKTKVGEGYLALTDSANKANNSWRTVAYTIVEPAAASSPSSTLVLVENEYNSFCHRVRRSRLYSPECNHTMSQGNLRSSEEEVDPTKSQTPRPLLVTGTGRSGTTFLVHVLRWMGLDIQHDSWRDLQYLNNSAPDGAVSWVHAFDRTENCDFPHWAGFRRRLTKMAQHEAKTKKSKREHHWVDRRNFRQVMLLVRNPLESIRSRWNKGALSFTTSGNCNTVQSDFVSSANNTNEDTIRITLRHWVLWNSFVESLLIGRGETQSTEPLIFRTEELTIDAGAVFSLLRSAGLDDQTQFDQSELQEYLDGNAKQLTHTNANHTDKPDFEFTWEMLHEIDKDYAIMAQLMAVRYGYIYAMTSINEAVIDEQSLSLLQLGDNVRQECGFRKSRKRDHPNKWSCRLVHE